MRGWGTEIHSRDVGSGIQGETSGWEMLCGILDHLGERDGGLWCRKY